jgi:hypothetical protein
VRLAHNPDEGFRITKSIFPSAIEALWCPLKQSIHITNIDHIVSAKISKYQTIGYKQNQRSESAKYQRPDRMP